MSFTILHVLEHKLFFNFLFIFVTLILLLVDNKVKDQTGLNKHAQLACNVLQHLDWFLRGYDVELSSALFLGVNCQNVI